MKTYLKILNNLVWLGLLIACIALPSVLGWVSTGVEDILWNAGYKFYFYSALAIKISWVLFATVTTIVASVLTDKKIDKLFK